MVEEQSTSQDSDFDPGWDGVWTSEARIAPDGWMEKLQFPRLTNTWTMPVQNRLDMELTGIKTPVGLKIQGPNVEVIQQVGAPLQQILENIPELRSVFAERVAEGFYINFYINVEVNRLEAARYGLTVGDVHRAVTSGIGGENIAENVEGRGWFLWSSVLLALGSLLVAASQVEP